MFYVYAGYQPPMTSRFEAIDQYRGFAILLMVLANYLNNVQLVPGWLKHASDVGYTIVDLVAPMFIFAMGLTYGLSFRRRLSQQGNWKTYEHFIARYLALLGLGYLTTLVWQLSKINPPTINWGLLQALGAAGLITLPFIRLPIGWRIGTGLSLLAIYQVLLDRFWLQDVLVAPHNGPWGALSWGAMLILATALADLSQGEQQARRYYPLVSAVFALGGVVLTLLIPVSKDRASASYILLSLGLSALVFYGFLWLDRQWNKHLPILTAWGRNALLLYLLQYLFLGAFALPAIPSWYVQAPLWLVIIQLAFILIGLSWIGNYFDQRKLYFVL